MINLKNIYFCFYLMDSKKITKKEAGEMLKILKDFKKINKHYKISCYSELLVDTDFYRFESDFKEAFDELEKVKSDNVVEIVRCNDCKYLKDFECKFLKSRIGGKDFFCGIGTREED